MRDIKSIFNKPPRDPARIPELLKLIESYWEQPQNIDLRLCQLLSNIVNLNLRKTNDLFYVEDQELIEIFNQIKATKI